MSPALKVHSESTRMQRSTLTIIVVCRILLYNESLELVPLNVIIFPLRTPCTMNGGHLDLTIKIFFQKMIYYLGLIHICVNKDKAIHLDID